VARAEADIAHRADTDGVSVNWLMVAEAQRFPELAAMVACERRPAEVVGQIAAALEREARADALAIEPRHSPPSSSSSPSSACRRPCPRPRHTAPSTTARHRL
jgi:hypothetical protein